MAGGQLGVILKMAQTINPQIERDRHFEIDLKKLRQLPAGTLGCEVARFLDEQGFEPIASGDWIQRNHDVWHVLTGLSPSTDDEFVLQAFTRSQVFRPSCAILVLVGLISGKCTIAQIIKGLKYGKLAARLIDWNPESDWETPLSEVRKKLGILLLSD
ncbi:Coq4 family protein [Microcoleus sp. herbarium19]|uniref:Coq4 family protein n=1 Tax=unclassified Microcoleus TaxID=2642155 RepID=UPI002FCFAF1E